MNIEQEIINLYLDNKRIIDICRILKIGNRKVSKVLISNNINIRSNRFNNLTNTIINNWKIIDRDLIKKSKNTYWNCICLLCNSSHSIVSDNLTSGASTKCIECGRLGMRKGYKELSGTHWSDIINGANKRNLEFNITKEYIYNLFLKQNKKCALSNVDIILGYFENKKLRTASLDRINNSKGYIKGNVWWIHKTVNFMKWTSSVDDFIKCCENIYSNKNNLLFPKDFIK